MTTQKTEIEATKKREKGNRYYAVSSVIPWKVYRVSSSAEATELVEAGGPIEACQKAKATPRFTDHYFKACEAFSTQLRGLILCREMGTDSYAVAFASPDLDDDEDEE